MKFKNFINEKAKWEKWDGKKWTGKTERGRKVSMGQDKSGMYSGEIRDEYGDIESSCLVKTKQEVDKFFHEHGIKKIK